MQVVYSSSSSLLLVQALREHPLPLLGCLRNMDAPGRFLKDVLKEIGRWLPVCTWSTARATGTFLRDVVHEMAGNPEGLRVIMQALLETEVAVEDEASMPVGCLVDADDVNAWSIIQKVFGFGKSMEQLQDSYVIPIQRMTLEVFGELQPWIGRLGDGDTNSTLIRTSDDADAFMHEMYDIRQGCHNVISSETKAF